MSYYRDFAFPNPLKFKPGPRDYFKNQFNRLGVNADKCRLNKKWRGRDLNPRHKAYESLALTLLLYYRSVFTFQRPQTGK